MISKSDFDNCARLNISNCKYIDCYKDFEKCFNSSFTHIPAFLLHLHRFIKRKPPSFGFCVSSIIDELLFWFAFIQHLFMFACFDCPQRTQWASKTRVILKGAHSSLFYRVGLFITVSKLKKKIFKCLVKDFVKCIIVKRNVVWLKIMLWCWFQAKLSERGQSLNALPTTLQKENTKGKQHIFPFYV